MTLKIEIENPTNACVAIKTDQGKILIDPWLDACLSLEGKMGEKSRAILYRYSECPDILLPTYDATILI